MLLRLAESHPCLGQSQWTDKKARKGGGGEEEGRPIKLPPKSASRIFQTCLDGNALAEPQGRAGGGRCPVLNLENRKQSRQSSFSRIRCSSAHPAEGGGVAWGASACESQSAVRNRTWMGERKQRNNSPRSLTVVSIHPRPGAEKRELLGAANHWTAAKLDCRQPGDSLALGNFQVSQPRIAL